MTVIAGIIGPDGEIYMAGDSAGTALTGRQSVNTTHKVFVPTHSPAFIIGISGDYRMGQVLKYRLKVVPPGPKKDIEGFMSTEFVDSVRLIFDDAGILTKSEEGVDQFCGTFLVGYQGRLFRIEENFQVITDDRGYMACGDGEDLALGVLFATDPEVSCMDRLKLAMSAAEAFNSTVRAPFQYMIHSFDMSWYRKQTRKRRGKAKQ